MTDPNAEAIEAWNTILFDKFMRFRHLLDDGLGVFGAATLERHPPKEGARVLDIGCGFGTTTLDIAKLVGPRGEAVGVDAAARFVAYAEGVAKEKAVANAKWLVADVQKDDLRGPYDQAFSRFGTMFFTSPVAAFRNVKRSLVPGGKLSMVVWRKKEEAGFFYEVEQLVLSIIPHPQKREGDVTCGPGPFSLGSADLASAQLVSAGYDRITFERLDAEMLLGKDVDDALALAMTLGPAGEILRLAREEGEKRRPELETALRGLLGKYRRADGVWGPASAWIVSARAA